jgi:hypothetical protein
MFSQESMVVLNAVLGAAAPAYDSSTRLFPILGKVLTHNKEKCLRNLINNIAEFRNDE